LFALLFGTAVVLLRLSIPEQREPNMDWLDEGANIRITVGLRLIPFAGIAFLWFLGVIRDRFKESEDQLFSSVVIGSGLLFLAMVFVSAALAGGILATVPLVAEESIQTEVANFGRAVMLQVSNVYALRMAGVLLISLGTMWLRTGVLPRWLAIVTYGTAAVLLLVTSLSLWVTLIFPTWVLGVSVLILYFNYRHRPEAR
jgi:hypothetical protein